MSDPRAAVAAIAQLVARRTGLVFAAHRRVDVETGVLRAMARAGMATPGAYLAALETGATPLDELVAELTVGESHFLRHPAQLAWLSERIFPELLRRHRDAGPLRMWSAGCASGEEAYSLVMAAESSGLRERVDVLGTDLSPRAIARARAGRYRAWSLRGVDDVTRGRCFTRVDGGWQIAARLQRRTRFEVHNLAVDHGDLAFPGIGEMDLIVCRNVLIYLDAEAIGRATRGLLATLSDGGWLILGPSDPSLPPESPVDTLVTPAGVLYRKRTAAARPVVVPEAVTMAPTAAAVTQAPPTPDQRGDEGDDDAAARVLALARSDGAPAAIPAAAEAARHHPLSPALHLLHARLLLDAGRDAEAVMPLRRVLYLDRSVAIAHFLMGGALARAGKAPAALRAYRHARDRAAAMAPDQPLPLGDGQRAGELVVAVAARIAALAPARIAS